MRSHTKRCHPIPQPPWGSFVPLDSPTLDRLLLETAFRTNASMCDYGNCDLCGNPIGFAEFTATPDPPIDRVARICWRCTIGILHYRGALDINTEAVPDPHGSGDYWLRIPDPQHLSRSDRPS